MAQILAHVLAQILAQITYPFVVYLWPQSTLQSIGVGATEFGPDFATRVLKKVPQILVRILAQITYPFAMYPFAPTHAVYGRAIDLGVDCGTDFGTDICSLNPHSGRLGMGPQILALILAQILVRISAQITYPSALYPFTPTRVDLGSARDFGTDFGTRLGTDFGTDYTSPRYISVAPIHTQVDWVWGHRFWHRFCNSSRSG